MLIGFFYIEGIVHKELVSPGQPMNAAFDRDFLMLMRGNVRGKRLEKWYLVPLL